MAKLTGAMLALVVMVSAASVRAEDGAIEKLYGEGVHAFFAGDLQSAQKHLDASIAAGNRDPRCYYYRGLTLGRLGEADAAKADLRAGATLEAQSPETSSLINRSIQRIQGTTRLSLEKYRSDAHIAALAARKAREAQRYGAARASAIQDLEKQAGPAAAAELLPDADAKPALDADELLRNADAKPAADAAADVPKSDPFGDDAAATDPAAEAPDAEMPADEPPAAEPPKVDPPAADAPAADTPAAEETPDATDPPVIEETPEVEPPMTEETPDDLFGEDLAAP